jgi:hypothetical protein
MAITVNGKPMKDAVIKTEQFEMRILEVTPDVLKISVTGITDSFNFVPRFVTIAYPERTITARDSGPVTIRNKETTQLNLQFNQKLRLEAFMPFDFRYANKKLATINVE